MKKTCLILIFSFLSLIVSSQDLTKLIQNADSLLNIKSYREAITLYEKIITKDTINPKIFNSLAVCYFNLNNVDSAILMLQKSKKINPQYADTYRYFSELYTQLDDYDSALVYIKKAIEIKPDTAAYDILEGNIYFLKNNLNFALKSYKNSIKKDNKFSTGYYFVAYTYLAAKFYDSAHFYIDIAISLETKPLFYELKSKIYYEESKFSDALTVIEKALEIEPNNISYINLKANYLIELDQINEALNMMKLYLNEYNADIYYNTILIYYRMNEIDSAFYYIKKSREFDPKNDVFYYLEGNIYYLNKDYLNANICFKAAIELNKGNNDYFFMYCNSKNLINTVPEVLDDNFKFFDFNVQNFKNFIKLPKNSDSKYYYNKLLSKFNTDPTSLGIDEYFMFYVGCTLSSDFSGYTVFDRKISNAFENEDYQYCIELAEMFVEKHPSSIYCYYYMANSYYHLENIEKAMYYLTIYYGFVNGILSTGNGESKENAYIVSSITDEYIVFNYYNLNTAGQELIKDKKQIFDILYYYYNNQKLKMYFNINLFYGKK